MANNLSVKTIRTKNTINTIKSILAKKKILRNELSKMNNISVMTVKNIIDDLINNDIVVESVSESEIGRKPKVISISPKLGIIVCISLASKEQLRYILYDVHGELVVNQEIYRDPRINYTENLKRLIAQIKTDLGEIGKETLGIGISVPSVYYEDRDIVNHDLIADFKNLHLKKIFTEAFDLNNIKIMHDVHTAAQAEYNFSRLKVASLFYFYVGDGIGGAFIEDGMFYQGENSVAGEVGRCLIDNGDGEETLESIASIPNIVDKIGMKYPNITFSEILNRYENGDDYINAELNKIMNIISKLLFNIVWVLNPSKIVIDSNCNRFAQLLSNAAATYSARLQGLPIHATMTLSPSVLNDHYAMQGLFHVLLDGWLHEMFGENGS